MEDRASKAREDAAAPPRLSPSLLSRLAKSVARPAYDRAALKPGLAHLGVGAFHRCHQEEFTDDLLAERFDRWGVVGLNVRPPALEETLGPQGSLYTRLLRQDDRVEARLIGSLLSVVDSQASPEPALAVLASPDIELATLTITEKGYCHRPATGELDLDRAEIRHDLADPAEPSSVPGLLVEALARRRATHGAPLTLMSCDNIPANGAILKRVVMALAARRDASLAAWIERHVTFPSTMVDRIVPATTDADIAFVRDAYGYDDRAVVVGEPFRQWVIEDRFAGGRPAWDLVGATFVADVTAHEHLKMRVLNAAQSTLSYLGVLAGYEHSFEAVADPALRGFVLRMLLEETLPTLAPVPGIDPRAYVGQSLHRIANTAIRHRCHQIATDGSQKIVQRLVDPLRERALRGEGFGRLAAAVAAWMAYLVLAAPRFGRRWPVEDPYAARIAGIADATGDDAPALTRAILAIDGIFDPSLAASEAVTGAVAASLAGFLSGNPLALIRTASRGTP